MEAVVVSPEAASGKTRRRVGDEDGDTDRDHLSLHPAQPSQNSSNHIEPNVNHMCKSIEVPGLVAYENKNNFVETRTNIPQVEMNKKTITGNNNSTITNKDGKINKTDNQGIKINNISNTRKLVNKLSKG